MKFFYHALIVCLIGLISCAPLKSYAEIDEKAKSFLILNNPLESGFFAIFSSVLSALNIYDQGQCAGIKIELTGQTYLDSEYGANWWDYFFEPIDLGKANAPTYAFSIDEILHLVNAGFCLSREKGFELIQKYIHLKPNVQQEMDDFVARHFNGRYVIGVHHRGTDKRLEAPIVPYFKTIQTLQWLVANLPDSIQDKISVYVATDDQNFLTCLTTFFPSQVICNDFVRSTDEKPIHYSHGLYRNNYQKGKEALLDCLLLSKCDWLLFPASSSFGMAVVKFNPYMPAIALTAD